MQFIVIYCKFYGWFVFACAAQSCQDPDKVIYHFRSTYCFRFVQFLSDKAEAADTNQSRYGNIFLMMFPYVCQVSFDF